MINLTPHSGHAMAFWTWMAWALLMTTPLGAQKIDTVRVDEATVARETKLIEAISARMKGELDKSRTSLESMIATEDDPVLRYELARVHAELEDYKAAEKELRSAIDMDGNNEWYWQYLADIGKTTNQPALCIEAYEALLAEHPDRHAYHDNLALHHLEAGQVDAALHHLSELERYKGMTLETVRRRHKIHDKIGQETEALQVMLDFIHIHPNDIEMMHAAAAYAEHIGQSNRAKSLYEQVLVLDPNDVEARQKMQILKGEHMKADDIDALLSQTGLTLDEKIKLLLPAIDELRASDTPVDSIWFARVASLESVHNASAKSKALLGDLHFLNKDLPRAIEAYKTSIDLDDNHYFVWNQLLFVTAQYGDFVSLSELAENAMDRFPNQALPYAYLARSIQKDDPAQAERLVQQAKMVSGGQSTVLNEIDQIFNTP